MIQPDSWHGMQLAAGALCRALATAFMDSSAPGSPIRVWCSQIPPGPFLSGVPFKSKITWHAYLLLHFNLCSTHLRLESFPRRVPSPKSKYFIQLVT
jgi:hypothetical protein